MNVDEMTKEEIKAKYEEIVRRKKKSFTKPVEPTISLRDARRELFHRFNCDDASEEYKKEFQALTERYQNIS